MPGLVRETVLDVGYDSARKGFDGAACGVQVSVGGQSPDIAQGVERSLEARDHTAAGELDRQGAGDQGMMFGFACRETPELMPLPILLAHRLAEGLARVRRSGELPFLGPDGKTQVTIAYADGRPRRLDTVVVSAQHDAGVDVERTLAPAVERLVVRPELERLELAGERVRLLVNPTGRFERGGPAADTGVTGRKIIIDTYGGMARHGGGAFSGKDPSKVDRSAAYALRWVAKNVVAAELAARCEIQVAYAIGAAAPVSLMIDCFGTEKVPVDRIQAAVTAVFDLRPAAIIRDLGLRRPIYRETAAYGHFGRAEGKFPWERTDRVDALLTALEA